jgi:hypothetical protein
MMGCEMGKIYYTLDGSDPRLPGGGISKTPVEYTAPVRIRDKNARDGPGAQRIRIVDGPGGFFRR